MTILNLLDEPVGKRLKRGGYPVCPKCNRYEHHFKYPGDTRGLTTCQECGTTLVLENEQTWRQFIERTAYHGSGPLNTVYSYCRDEIRDRAMKDPEFLEDIIRRSSPDNFLCAKCVFPHTRVRRDKNGEWEHLYSYNTSASHKAELDLGTIFFWLRTENWPEDIRAVYEEAGRIAEEATERDALNMTESAERWYDMFCGPKSKYRGHHEWKRIEHLQGDFTHYCRCGAFRTSEGKVVDVWAERRKDRATVLK